MNTIGIILTVCILLFSAVVWGGILGLYLAKRELKKRGL